MNLANLIDRNAAFTPDKPAIRFVLGPDVPVRTLTYADFARRIADTASALRSQLGIAAGNRIAILAVNHPDYLVLLYACARLGAMLVPVNWRLAVPEQLYVLRDADIQALIVEEIFAPVIDPLSEVLPGTSIVGLDSFTPEQGVSLAALLDGAGGDAREFTADASSPLLIVYTSGTTGHPKGAVLRQEALIWNGVMSQHMHDMTVEDHILTVLPLFHVGGLNVQTTPALHVGATVTLLPRFTPDATLHAISRDRPTLAALVPSTIQPLVEHARWDAADVTSLRAVTTGSTVVPQRLVDALTARHVPVLMVYGATETCPLAVYTRLAGDWRRAGSTGLTGLVCETRIVNDRGTDVPAGTTGEVLVRGPNVFSGYWRNPGATEEALRDGWYFTGDIAMRDADGHVFIQDRKKNLIKSGGENIYPAEVERVLYQHPAVADAAVIGRPDARWQEVPIAYIVPRKGHTADTCEIERFCLTQLARYKVPREFVWVESLPRNASGKVQHFRLRHEAPSAACSRASSTTNE